MIQTMRCAPTLLTLPMALLPAMPATAEEIGLCRFDPTTVSFAGSPVEQATCLLQHVNRAASISPQPLPDRLRHLLKGANGPTPAQTEAALTALPEDYAAYARSVIAWPASRTQAGLPALYFVIHDTSTPFLGDEPFPADPDHDAMVNDLTRYVRPQPVAHYFINRLGQIWAGHDISEPWRATKLESFVVGLPAKGRFIHVETVQPRRYAPGSHWLGDTLALEPGFSDAQYKMLAALYVYSSARAGHWLIPAQHATIDSGIPEGHDDPQNFDLAHFAAEVERLVSADKSGS